ncbi:hypothetical protein F5B22DRAFT_96124 [Xylaria bambusicola]|uniref:uncharacterized protein n=1 Tax=Xylaria bambusicola TaxID=326684 RepID=UPI0020072E4B|nr:uncharacterized protein F5B22DRAFT_96124 [Xylaria bambusicola]KAI0517716.1 hypothetical protein F5B22DRAFT_96124 [Xylaria bambusicola]
MSSAQAQLPMHLTNNPANNPTSLDGAGFANAAGPTHHRSPSASYFPYPAQDMAVEDQTLSNTMANAHIASSVPTDNHQYPSRQPRFNEEWDSSVRGSSVIDGPSALHHQRLQQQQRQRSQSPNVHRANSISSRSEMITGDSASTHGISLSRGNTLKKKNSMRRSASLKRSGSRRSMKAGSVRSLALQSSHEPDEIHSVFYCPVPTSGAPTELLAQRFQDWRKILKDLIAYFREIQNHYEHRSKSLLKLANVCNNISTPPGFLGSGGLDEALQTLRGYHKTAIIEANKAKEIEGDVILALTGLRSDLNLKMKEIKGLSGDFKNSVEKEMEGTRRAVNALQEILGQSEVDPSITTGKQDPYLLRLAVDRQVERQLDEENYLHQAYLNLEASGRELESIVVSEIQKSYNAYAGILKREADAGYNTIDELRSGPISMPKDREWVSFIQRDSQFVDPEIPIRTPEHIHYPGQDHFACQEIRAGLLERKSKYLKSYTAGWYVLSPTHLHEFKSADKTGAPVMSLYLPEQKLGSHSTEGGSSSKFILKGRQTGTMHRGHTWVFRAESHDTMMAWYEDIKALTEKSPEEVSSFVRGHARTYSRSSQRSVSSDGVVDEEDDIPFSADPSVTVPSSRQDSFQGKSHTGGRFPSELQVNAQRGLLVPSSPTSSGAELVDNETSTRGAPANGANPDRDVIAAAGSLPGSGIGDNYPNHYHQQPIGQSYGNTSSMRIDQAPSHAAVVDYAAREDGVNPYSGQPVGLQRYNSGRSAQAPIVVTGPIPISLPQTSGTSITSLSENSSLASSYSAQPHSLADRSSIAKDERYQPSILNGSLKPAPRGASGETFGLLNGQTRPGNERNNSIPHVPGEYPRGTPA